jgi:hypothetical protein
LILPDIVHGLLYLVNSRLRRTTINETIIDNLGFAQTFNETLDAFIYPEMSKKPKTQT